MIKGPARHRRKSYTCVLCKEEETRDWDHICVYCRRAWKQGVEYRDIKPPEGVHNVHVAWYWKLYHFAGIANRYPEHGRNAKSRLRTAVMKLVGAVQITDAWRGSGTPVGIPPGDHDQSVSRYAIVGDEETEQTMRDLYEAASDLMAEAYEDGQRRGKSFITDLAEGKLTAKDLERL